MYIGLGLLLLIASAAAIWGVASYAQRHWPTQLQYVAAWIASSVIAAWIWNYAWLAHTLITAGPTYLCGWQDTARCTFSAFLREQLEWFQLAFVILLVPSAAIAGLVFVPVAYLRKDLASARDEWNEYPTTSTRDIALTSVFAVIGTAGLVLTQPIHTITELLIISAAAAAASLFARMFLLRRRLSGLERDKIWLWSSLGLAVLASVMGNVSLLTDDFRSAYGIIALILWFPLSAAAYVVPVAAFSRLIILSGYALAKRG